MMDQNHSVTPTKLEKGDSAISRAHQVQKCWTSIYAHFFQSYGILKTVRFNFYWFILPPSSLWPMGIKRTVDAVSPSSIVKIAKPFGHSYGYAHIYISLYFYYEWIYLCWCHFHVQHPISKDFPRSCPSTGLFQWWWWFLGPLDGLFLPGPDCCGHRTASTASTLAHILPINALIMKVWGC